LADIDDRARAPVQHMPAERPAAPEQAVEIDLHVEAPVLVGRVLGLHIAFGDPGIVDENVDAAVLPDDVGGSLVDILRPGDVELYSMSRDPELAQVGEPGIDTVARHVGDDHLGACLAERLGTGGPDSLAAA